MRFADGLPVNLKHPVLPKPKPPLPLFSTMPRTSHNKSSDAIEVPRSLQSPTDDSGKPPLQLPPKHSQTLSTIHHNNNIKKKSKEHSNSVFSTLRLRSPKKSSILESMSTLRKNKHKLKANSLEDKPSSSLNTEEQQLKQAEKLLKNLSFSTEFSSLNTSAEDGNANSDEFYNVPKNNAAINTDVLLQEIQEASAKKSVACTNSNIENKTEEEVEYFTKSDIIIERERNNKICKER